MESEFEPILVKQKELCFEDSIKYACFKGAQQNTVQIAPANSQSTQAIVWNTPTPSEVVCLSRKVKWEGEVTISVPFYYKSGSNLDTINISSVLCAGSNTAIATGGAQTPLTSVSGPANFPLHSCLTTMQCTLNDKAISQNIQDVLPLLTTFNDFKKANQENGTCPHQRDTYFNIQDGFGCNNNAYGRFTDSTLNSPYIPNGAFAYEYSYIDSNAPTVTNVVTNASVANANRLYTFLIKIKSCEPVLISPFVWNKQNDGSALFGLQTIGFRFDVGQANRVWRTSVPILSANPTTNGIYGYIGGFNFVSFTNHRMHFNYLTPYPSQLLPQRCILPYMQIDRYITNVGNASYTASNPVIDSNTKMPTFDMTFNSINFTSIPDKIAIAIQPRFNYKTNNITDWNAVINSVSISWNNQQGLLGSANIYDLYRMSCEAGSNLSYPEFSGRGGTSSTQVDLAPATDGKLALPTIGSMLILDLAKHIQLDAEYYAPGSLAVVQVIVTVNYSYQNTTQNLQANYLQGILFAVNSGILVVERGQTEIYTGILSKQQVLEASASQEYYNDADIQRLVGGSLFGSLKNGLSSIWRYLKPAIDKTAPIAKKVLREIDNPHAKKGADVIEALGYGKTPHDTLLNMTEGGGPSGGGASGGIRRRLK